MTYKTQQMRSADEGMTIFYYCVKCGNFVFESSFSYELIKNIVILDPLFYLLKISVEQFSFLYSSDYCF
jgi:hypothetical protein